MFFVSTPHPSGKNTKLFFQKWHKKFGITITVRGDQIDQFLWFLIDLMMFGMQFFANFETKILFIFLKGVAYKKNLFGGRF